MESLQIDIIHPKAKLLIKDLAKLNLIRIKKVNVKSEFEILLKKFRKNSPDIPTLEEITREVELVRQARYED